ncbi:hypothetical protein [Nocardia jiangxiensis]|uniref:GLTT repeat-containing protein n=1 Tax=Nocardia jiangxiensis TaxID=282685 RepID=A0ABW6RWW2_9NOCA|nr:hypothetical protein [Nocardia jiangxiensis]
MARQALVKTARVLVVGALPVAAMAVFAGGASADASVPTAPAVTQSIAAGVPLEPVTTNPHAQYPDPVLNGAAGGAAIGSATGSFIDPLPTLLGAAIGAGVGVARPDLVPQILP